MDFMMMDGLIGLIALVVIALLVAPMIARSDHKVHSSLWNLAPCIGLMILITPFAFGGTFPVGSIGWICTTILLTVSVLATLKFSFDALVEYRTMHATGPVKAKQLSSNRADLRLSSR